MRDPWKKISDMDPDREYLVMASLLPARGYSSTGALFSGARRTKAQLRGAEGLIGFSLMARPTRKQYGTLSVWVDRGALDRFARAAPHGEIMRDLRPHMGTTTFTTWTIHGRDGRPVWADAFAHLAAATAS